MIVSVHAYVVMGDSLNVTVSTVDDSVSRPNRRSTFFGRSVVPLGDARPNYDADVVFAIGEELLNLAYRAGDPSMAPRGTDDVPFGQAVS